VLLLNLFRKQILIKLRNNALFTDTVQGELSILDTIYEQYWNSDTACEKNSEFVTLFMISKANTV
jgi:hypothetical protein